MPIGLSHTYQDLKWTDDMSASAEETASDYESLTQDVLHILMEVQGSNPADPENGIGAANYLNGSSAQLATMPARIDAQLASVARITSSHTSISQLADLSWLIAVAIKVGNNIFNLQYSLGPNGLTIASP